MLTYVRELPCRPVNATDFAALKLLHAELFPVEYDDVFFHKTTRGLDGIVSWAALRPPAHLHRQLERLSTQQAAAAKSVAELQKACTSLVGRGADLAAELERLQRGKGSVVAACFLCPAPAGWRRATPLTRRATPAPRRSAARRWRGCCS